MTNTLQRSSKREGKHLPTVEIQNFRAFRSVVVERLGNVNLIVGKNSVGKSVLLEALRLYAARGAQYEIENVLQERDEWSRGRGSEGAEQGDTFIPVSNLFYGRPQVERNRSIIKIGPYGVANETLSFEIGWFARKSDDLGQIRLERVSPPTGDHDDLLADNEIDEAEPRLVVQFGNEKSTTLRLDRDWARTYRPELEALERTPRPIYVPVAGLSMERIVPMWENISLTEGKEAVIRALQIVVPGVENLDIKGRGNRAYHPVIMAKLIGIERPVTVRSLGEGIVRLFGLALALVNAQDTVLLIDEIDSGLHYSVQLEVWRLIFSAAQRLNVQVFATTHSWDCVAAFQQVAASESSLEGMLIRLQTEGDAVTTVLVDEATLAVVTQEQIEIR